MTEIVVDVYIPQVQLDHYLTSAVGKKADVISAWSGLDTYPFLEFVEFGAGVVERVMVEGDVDLSEEVVTSEPVAVPDHHTQRP